MRKPRIFILQGFQVVARGRGAIATTTPDWVFSWIRTLKGVPETLGPLQMTANLSVGARVRDGDGSLFFMDVESDVEFRGRV